MEVNGNGHIDKDEILRLSSLSVGMDLTGPVIDRVKQAVMRQPWIEKVDIARRFSGAVSIMIRERRPIVLVNVGTVYQMDSAGVFLDIAPGSAPSLPVVSGLQDTVAGAMRCLRPASVRRFTAFWQQALCADSMMLHRISQTDFSKKSRIRLSIEHYPVIVEIDEGSVYKKLTQLSRLIQAIKENGDSRPATINMCYNNLAFVR